MVQPCLAGSGLGGLGAGMHGSDAGVACSPLTLVLTQVCESPAPGGFSQSPGAVL